METGKSFKIRKTGFNKTRNLQDIQDQELVANLDDLRISQQNFNEQANIIGKFLFTKNNKKGFCNHSRMKMMKKI